MKRAINYVINRSEITAGTRGASLGPEAVMAVARTEGSTLFSKYPKTYIKVNNDLLDEEIKHSYAKRIDGLIEVYDTLKKEVSGLLNNHTFPLILAGDHGSAGGTISGINAAFPDKTLGVVWIDAHGDLHTPYTTPSGNMHGMPLSTALNDDNREAQRNDLPESTIEKWETLKGISGAKQKVKPEHLAFIGVRDVEEEEVAMMKRLNLRNYTVAEVQEMGANAIVAKIESQLSDCDIIYVSFDVDSMDPDQTSYGTGTPVANGLSVEEARELLVAFAKNPKLVCMEFVEVNPCLDEKKNKMAEITYHLFKDVVSCLEN